MTPQNQIAQPSSSANPPSLSNRVATMGEAVKGEPQQDDQSNQKIQPDQSEQLVSRFSLLHRMFQDLTSQYPGGDDEVKNVQTALGNWLNKAAKQINESGGASTQ